MNLANIQISGYRSIRDFSLDLERITVLVGPNGCGKSNLYRALYLLHALARGDLSRAFAEEGGMPSALWAGPQKKSLRKEPRQLRVGVAFDLINYEMVCGLPIPTETFFNLDPVVKEEMVYVASGQRKVIFLERRNQSAWLRDLEEKRVVFPLALWEGESTLVQLNEPHRFPELAALRQEFIQWRFYHHFRTDAGAPIRRLQAGIRTPVLHHDGRDLAAALQTILEIGNGPKLQEEVERAFPGSTLFIKSSDQMFSIHMEMPGILRPLEARELSDGTLRYLCLLAALMSPRPPSFLALNEPETSIHPDLLEPLAKLIVGASKSSQVWVTTHSESLARCIEEKCGVPAMALEKVNGETSLAEG